MQRQVNVIKVLNGIKRSTILKYAKKDIQEYTEYGNANKFQQFVDAEQYYYSENGKIVPVNISKKSFERYFKGKFAQLDSFIKEKSLSGKELKDWIYAINFLNLNSNIK